MTEADNIRAALSMLDLFAGVGATSFDLTFKKLDEKQRTTHRNGQTVTNFRNSMPHLLQSSYRNRYSLIARPRSKKTALVQLDDLSAEKLAVIRSAAFCIVETSPDNFQAWIAIKGSQDEDFARRLKQGAGADVNASGATRWAGTANFKAKYAPDFPVIRLCLAQPGLIVLPSTLEAMNVLASPTPPACASFRATKQGRSLAILCAMPRASAQGIPERPGYRPARRIKGGFYLCAHCRRLGPQRRGDRCPALARKQQGSYAQPRAEIRHNYRRAGSGKGAAFYAERILKRIPCARM